MSQDSTLLGRIAERAGCPAEVAEQVLGDYGLNLSAGSRRHRSLRLDRLRLRGDKAGEVEPGKFDETFRFGLGVTVIAAGNLRGKTSILEVVTLVLRGEMRNLQADVLSWLTEVSLDVHVNGHPVGFRISLKDSGINRGLILAGTIEALRESDDTTAHGVTQLARARTSAEWAEQAGAFMMNQLGLEEMQVFNRARNDDEAGTIKSHGWPAYYSVLYPPSGADTVLLGSTPSDFLPVRLMQVFLDMPEATRSMRATALVKRLDSELKAEQRRGKDAAAVLATQLAEAVSRQEAAARRLAEVNAQSAPESLRELSRLAGEAAARLTRARQASVDADAAFAGARLARADDEKALNTLRENAAASSLFHGLDPQSCPRCETPISTQRRAGEHENHQCAVCETPLSAEDGDDHAEQLQEAAGALAATRAAEKALDAASSRARTELDDAQRELDALSERTARAQAAHQAAERVEAEQEMATATAVVGALQAVQPGEPEPSDAQKVITAADEVLHGEIVTASAGLYTDLSAAARDLAVSFGISELEAVRVKANGTMDVTKGGGARSSFSAQSPGERLRLRYALLVALLRTARARGIAGHPGLLLLDSLKAEEVQDDHARTLLQGLVTAAAEEPGLQVLVTTADQALPRAESGVAAIITPGNGRTALF